MYEFFDSFLNYENIQRFTLDLAHNEIRENGGSTPCRKVNEIAMRFPDKVAFRDKRFGIWSEISYQSFWEQAQWVGCALNYFGVDKRVLFQVSTFFNSLPCFCIPI